MHCQIYTQAVDNEQDLLGQRHFKILITDNLQLDRTRTTLCRSQEQELQLEGRQFSPAHLAPPSPGNQKVFFSFSVKRWFLRKIPEVQASWPGSPGNRWRCWKWNGLKNLLESFQVAQIAWSHGLLDTLTLNKMPLLTFWTNNTLCMIF